MKLSIIITAIFLFLNNYLNGQEINCYLDDKAEIARNNMSGADDGLTCANAAKFYVKLCQYKTEPLTEEAGVILRNELQVIKKAYNDYGMYCKDIGKITDEIPESPTLTLDFSEPNKDEGATADDILVEAISNLLNGENNNTEESGGGGCSFAARDKFGGTQFSSEWTNTAANQYEGYRCHCINGTLPKGFTDSSFDPKPNDLGKALRQIKGLRDRYYKIKKSSDPELSPLPSKCIKNKNGVESPSNGSTTNKSIPSYYQNLNGEPDNLYEKILKEFNPEGYLGISYAKTMKEQGARIVNGLVQNVERYGTLIKTNDPATLLDDFRNKFSTLEDIEANYEGKAFSFGQQRGKDLANQINTKDYEGAFINSISFLNTLGEMRRAEKELEARKKALEQQKRSQMFAIYQKAWESNNELLQMYRKRAAFAESLYDEQENFQYVFHLVCYIDDMSDRISAGDDNWYINRCELPELTNEIELANNLIPRDQQLLKVAKRKHQLYEKFDNGQIYLDAAISFAAAAVKVNPSAENYLELAKLYAESSNILALVSLESSKSLNESLYSGGLNLEFYNDIRDAATNEVRNAIVENNVNYLESFVSVGLHKAILLDGKPLLSFALILDQPDAVQTILNHEATNLDQSTVQKKIHETINMAAFLNSANTIVRLKELGISFNNNERNPVDYAVDGLSPNSILELVKNSRYKTYFDTKYENHPVNIMIKGLNNPALGALELVNLSESNVEILSKRILELAPRNTNYYELIGFSPVAKSVLSKDQKLMAELIQRFEEQLILPSPLSTAHYIWKTDLIKSEEITMNTLGNEQIDLKTIKIFQGYVLNLIDRPDLLKIGLTKSPNEFQNNSDYEGKAFILKQVAVYYKWIKKFDFKDEHLSTLAYFFANSELFKEIDKTEDISNVKLKSGQTLLDIMMLEEISSYAPPLGMTPQFLSADFDVSKNFEETTYLLKIIEQVANTGGKNWMNQFDIPSITGNKNSDLNFIQKNVIERMSHLRNGGVRNYPLTAQFSDELIKASAIKSLLEIYGLSPTSKISKSGGTLLHWVMDNSGRPERYNPEKLMLNSQLLRVILSMGIDPKILDNQGINAFDYLKKNKKKLKSIKCSHCYLYPDNDTFTKGSIKNAYKYFKYMLEPLN